MLADRVRSGRCDAPKRRLRQSKELDGAGRVSGARPRRSRRARKAVDYSGQAYDAMLRSALRGEARDPARPRPAWEEPPRCGPRVSIFLKQH